MSTFESIKNIRLAWRRILTGQNYSYREFQSIEVNAFAWAEEENITQLHKELRNNIYEPSDATKIFIPKASGLLRPITILRIRDTIIYQAIANVIAEKVYSNFSSFYFKLVFSSVLQKIQGHQNFLWFLSFLDTRPHFQRK